MNIEDINPIRGPVYIPSDWDMWMPYILGGLALIGIVIGIWNYTRRKKNTVPIELPIPPYEAALAELEASKKHMLPGKDKDLSIALSDAIRRYLETEHGARSTVKTSEEYLMEVHHNLTFHGPTLKVLTAFLRDADLAKFANASFTPQDQSHLYQTAKKFIELAHQEKMEAEKAAKLEAERIAR